MKLSECNSNNVELHIAKMLFECCTDLLTCDNRNQMYGKRRSANLSINKKHCFVPGKEPKQCFCACKGQRQLPSRCLKSP